MSDDRSPRSAVRLVSRYRHDFYSPIRQSHAMIKNLNHTLDAP
jgi:hypothetical protein